MIIMPNSREGVFLRSMCFNTWHRCQGKKDKGRWVGMWQGDEGRATKDADWGVATVENFSVRVPFFIE